MQYNINAFIQSNKQIQKKAKLFRKSFQLVERQVLSNYLRGYVAANEHQGSMKYQENRDRRKMPTKSRGYITGT